MVLHVAERRLDHPGPAGSCCVRRWTAPRPSTRSRRGRPPRRRLTPLHHRTILAGCDWPSTLEADLYAVAVSLAKAEDCSISGAW